MSCAVCETYNVYVFLLINTLIEETNLRNVNLKSVYNILQIPAVTSLLKEG